MASPCTTRPETVERRIRHQPFVPACLWLLGDMLAERVSAAWRHMEDRDLCARYCRINCLKSSKGAACCTGERAVVHSLGPHHRVACIVRTSTSATGDRAATVSTRITRDV